MAVLNHLQRGLAALAALVTAGCFLPTEPGAEPGPRFDHELHARETGLDCAACHTGVFTGEGRALPGPQICAPCHSPDRAVRPPKRGLDEWFDADGRLLLQRPGRLSEEIVFSHGEHRAQGLDCVSCHGASGHEPARPAGVVSHKDTCMTCHEQRGASTACSTCHREIGREWTPSSHDHGWQARHGQVVSARSQAVVDRCEMCHEQSTCQSCHQEIPPRDHTSHWRRRGHGIAVAIDRGRCFACHRDDSCVRCHQETPPISHTASFGSPTNRHCVSCHEPIRNEGCATCHRGTPSHATATPLPSNHQPGMNCRQCHGAGVALPHPDGGHACTSCHR